MAQRKHRNYQRDLSIIIFSRCRCVKGSHAIHSPYIMLVNSMVGGKKHCCILFQGQIYLSELQPFCLIRSSVFSILQKLIDSFANKFINYSHNYIIIQDHFIDFIVLLCNTFDDGIQYGNPSSKIIGILSPYNCYWHVMSCSVLFVLRSYDISKKPAIMI